MFVNNLGLIQSITIKLKDGLGFGGVHEEQMRNRILLSEKKIREILQYS